eukprot:TRINITY_DN255_c0_g1_i2.p1 TRINITY_DN255_c0_g1~~TRINITY_DN255_c0_g1_i2.p1  ORF type:complete len:189 (-),score=86.94 TRINITY_DN255_c0_g1_i2:92-658(-)
MNRSTFLLILLLGLVSLSFAWKDWSKVKDADLDKEINAMEDDDPDNPFRKNADGSPVPKESGHTQMAFVTLRPEYSTTKSATELLGYKWAEILKTGGVRMRPYAVEDDKLLFVTEGGLNDMSQVQKYVMDQPESLEFEWNQQKVKPSRIAEKAFKRDQKKKKQEEKKKAADTAAAAAASAASAAKDEL